MKRNANKQNEMPTDNLEKIKRRLVFDSEDEFYHLQILKRKKEHPDLGSNSVVIKTYYISSIEYLEQKWPEIKALADLHNARACINLNRRSFEKMAFHLLRKVADQIMNKDYRSARKAYESVCGSYMAEPEKKWIIDIDSKDGGEISYCLSVIALCEGNGKMYDLLETKNGWHIICSPFNVAQFQEYYKQQDQYECPDIQKNNPTILYIP